MNHSRLKEVKQRGNQMQLQSSTGSWLKKTVKARVRGGGCGNLDVGCTSDNISGSILNSSGVTIGLRLCGRMALGNMMVHLAKYRDICSWLANGSGEKRSRHASVDPQRGETPDRCGTMRTTGDSGGRCGDVLCTGLSAFLWL